MKKIIIVLLTFSIVNLYANNTYKNITLLDYAELVSHTNNVEIFVNEDLANKNISFFIQKDISPRVLLEAFGFALENKDMKLEKKGDIYYVNKAKEKNKTLQFTTTNQKSFENFQTSLPFTKTSQDLDFQLKDNNYTRELVKRKSYYYDLQNLNYKDIDKMLKLHKNILFTYLPDTNSIVYFATDDEKTHIESLIKKYDVKKLQTTIRLTIFTTRFDKLNEAGSNLKNIGFDMSNFLKLFGSFGSLRIASSAENKANLYGTIKFLEEHGITEINQSPTLLLRNGEKVIFNSVKNIPYLIQKKEVKDNQSSIQDTYEYKDIGLKISMLPRIFDDKTLVDFHLFIEDILSNDITPITSKIELKNTFSINKNEVILLSGLNRSSSTINKNKIPLLGDIPYIGRLFKYDGSSSSNEVTSIIIETLE